jgi:hypothetical protein
MQFHVTGALPNVQPHFFGVIYPSTTFEQSWVEFSANFNTVKKPGTWVLE